MSTQTPPAVAPSSLKRRFDWRGSLVLCGVIACAAAGLWLAYRWRSVGSDAELILALEQLQKGRSEQATELLKRWKPVSSRQREVALLNGAQLEEMGFHQQAVDVLLAVEPDGVLRPTILRWLGVSLFHAGRTIDAQWVFETLAGEYPDSIEAHRWLSTIYRKIGAMDPCLAELELLSQLDPTDYRSFHQMGRIYRQDHKREEKAIELFRESLQRNPPPSARKEIIRELAEALTEIREYSDALEMLATIPDDARGMALRAECLKALGESDDAAKALRRSLELNPRERRALMLSASHFLEQDENPAAAIPLVETILADDPHDYPARNLLALALRRTGRTEEADQEVARMNESRELRTRLDRLYLEAMRDPSDVSAREQLAVLCRQLGQHELADFWRRAAESVRHAAESDDSPAKPQNNPQQQTPRESEVN